MSTFYNKLPERIAVKSLILLVTKFIDEHGDKLLVSVNETYDSISSATKYKDAKYVKGYNRILELMVTVHCPYGTVNTLTGLPCKKSLLGSIIEASRKDVEPMYKLLTGVFNDRATVNKQELTQQQLVSLYYMYSIAEYIIATYKNLLHCNKAVATPDDPTAFLDTAWNSNKDIRDMLEGIMNIASTADMVSILSNTSTNIITESTSDYILQNVTFGKNPNIEPSVTVLRMLHGNGSNLTKHILSALELLHATKVLLDIIANNNGVRSTGVDLKLEEYIRYIDSEVYYCKISKRIQADNVGGTAWHNL